MKKYGPLPWALLFFLANPRPAPAQTNPAVPVSSSLITNLNQYWQLSDDEKTQLHPMRLEFLVYYCDPTWNVFWGRSDGMDTFLPLKGIPLTLRPGDRVALDGVTLPVNQEVFWDKTVCRVLSRSNALPVVSAEGHWLDVPRLDKHFVEVEALVDSETMTSARVLRLNLLVNDFNISAFVLMEATNPPPQLAGRFVRVKGVYTETFGPTGKIAGVTLWTPGLDYLEQIGSLESDPRFSRFANPVTLADDFGAVDPGQMVRVRGVVRSQRPGESVTIWDSTGQIRILTRQEFPLEVGDEVEAVGFPMFKELDRILDDGLFRLVAKKTTDFNPARVKPDTKIRLVDQVRGLDREQLSRGPAVNLEGVVAWVEPRQSSIFILDSSGGIRVTSPRFLGRRQLEPGMMVKVDGLAAMGEFAPVITNSVVRQTGTTSLPDAPLISLEEALTGTEDGRWVQIRGYVRRISEDRPFLRMELVAPGGEFTARIPKDRNLPVAEGAIVLVKGVCVVEANSRRQLRGVEIWSPLISDLQVEQSAPSDLFALPLRPLASLRQFHLFNGLNERVHVSGTVTLQVPGRYLYIEDGDSSVLALSDETNVLTPGDLAEVVGFCGNEGGNFLLREAKFRRVGSGHDLVPVQLPATGAVNEDLDGLLVRAEGLLIDSVKKPEEERLVIQGRGRIFETKLDGAGAGTMPKEEIGSKVSVTGVYRVQRDEYGNPRSFLLNLRSEDDVRVLQPPPWWTLSRLFWALGSLVTLTILLSVWALEIRRKNRLLLQSQAALKAAHDKLEERVRERTHELSEQIRAKEKAHARLSEAQRRLIHASRQAGMAEVATGVLHNVGNVLNSVNVSASLIGDSLGELRIENLSRAVALLNDSGREPAKFLSEDPRGRALPGYLRDVATVMVQHRRMLQDEVNSLIKQVDHVKAVVALQQGYAKTSNMSENLVPAEVMDDAFEINSDAYERHSIQVIRRFATVPSIFADRHKVLQILINLLSNAKYALATKTGGKVVTLGISADGPERVCFTVSDNGIGIAPENVSRIFTLGYTTRENGHGFGLHSGANAAREMGGELRVASHGPGQGSAFSLILPVIPGPCDNGESDLELNSITTG